MSSGLLKNLFCTGPVLPSLQLPHGSKVYAPCHECLLVQCSQGTTLRLLNINLFIMHFRCYVILETCHFLNFPFCLLNKLFPRAKGSSPGPLNDSLVRLGNVSYSRWPLSTRLGWQRGQGSSVLVKFSLIIEGAGEKTDSSIREY